MSIASLFQDTQTRTLRIKKYRFTSYPRSGFESLARIRKFMIVRNSSPRFALFYNRLRLAFDLLSCHFIELAMLEPIEQERKMEMQSHQICVIDLFGVSYDGTMPSIVFACDETWLGLFAVGPPNPPAVEAADRPDGRLCLFL
ncbi:MAG: hypothetical protein DME20_10660 [Verrucomicrobia bacterium]|nr:MAG: hypothetical protein DME20_10660 [Verrucomicrobiota bacterium]